MGDPIEPDIPYPTPMTKPSCATCPYWLAAIGRCNRRKPMVHGITGDDWCGDHPDFQAWLKNAFLASLCTRRND